MRDKMFVTTISEHERFVAAVANISDIRFHGSDVFVGPALWKVSPVALLDLICLRLSLSCGVGRCIYPRAPPCFFVPESRVFHQAHRTSGGIVKNVLRSSRDCVLCHYLHAQIHPACSFGGECRAIPDSSWIRPLILLLYRYKIEHPLLTKVHGHLIITFCWTVILYMI